MVYFLCTNKSVEIIDEKSGLNFLQSKKVKEIQTTWGFESGQKLLHLEKLRISVPNIDHFHFYKWSKFVTLKIPKKWCRNSGRKNWSEIWNLGRKSVGKTDEKSRLFFRQTKKVKEF